jgi:hypothetical protein
MEGKEHPVPPSEPGNIIRFTGLLSLATLVLCLVYGVGLRSSGALLTALALGGVIVAPAWVVTLLASALILARSWPYLAARKKRQLPGDGGVSDGWLDGRC